MIRAGQTRVIALFKASRGLIALYRNLRPTELVTSNGLRLGQTTSTFTPAPANATASLAGNAHQVLLMIKIVGRFEQLISPGPSHIVPRSTTIERADSSMFP